MGRSFGFSDAYAKRERLAARDRALNAQAKGEKVWYADGSDGDPRAGTAKDEWVRNEEAARQQAIADAPALEKLAERAEVRRFVDARGRTTELHQDISPGLHGQDVTIYGERATFETPEPEIKGGRPTGDMVQRFITESGVTGQVRAVKEAPGRHRLIVEKRKRYFT
jgi:hypothetical protein